MNKENNVQSISTIDELLQTKNEHYNNYSQKVVTECISKQIFDNAETALKTYQKCLNNIVGTETPILAVKYVLYELYQMQEPEFTDKQCYFILTRIADYIKHTDFGKWELRDETYNILKSHIVKFEKEFVKSQQKNDDIRETLKILMQKEISEFPKRLETLDDEKRLGIICRLMPYVFPKVETVEATRGENKDWYEN